MQKTDKKLFRCKKTTITLLLILTAAALMFLTAEKTKAAEVTISFLYEDSFTGVDGDTSNWSTGDNTVNLGTNHWDLLSGTADVNGYINGDNHMLTHRGTRGLGVAGQENDEVDSHVRPEKIEITFDTPHQLRYLEVRSLFTNEGPNGEPEEGDIDLYLNETFVVNYHLVGVEDLHAPGSIGKVNVTVPNLCVDKIVYYVKQNQVYTPWSEFAVAKLILSVDNTPPNVYKEHPEHGYTPEEEEKTAVVPAPWQYWTTFVGGVTAIITWDPPQVNESVAIIREYATSQYEIPLDNLTWEDPMIQELDWILIDDEPVTIPPGGNVTFDISTTEDDTAVLIKYTVAWASTPYETQAHFINEALLETGSPQVIIGQLSNFDVHNFLNTSMDNFELELYGVETSDVVDWYYSHWVPMPQLIPMRWGDTWYGGWGNSPQIKPLTDGVEVKWKEFNHPAQPCEWVHFGLRLKPTVQPWGVKAYWTKIISPPYLRSCAPITLWAEDPMEDCLSGVEGIYYGFYYNDVWHPTDQQDEYCGNHNITTYKYGRWWYTYTNPIHFHEECIHKLHYWTRDNAGNQGPVYKQVYYVDDTPPTVTKTHPPDYQALNDTTGWIKVCSKITLEAVDEGTPPCIAGVEGIYWGFWFEDVWHPMDPTDTYDGNIVTIQKHGRWWYIYDEVKKIHWLEPGKHILEYWTKDNVCNQGLIHKQIYWANNCQPEVWVDKNYHSGTSGWWITHFNTIQDALNWLQPYGVAHINPGVYTENVSVDDVPWCDNTGVTIEGSTGCPPLPIGNSAVIDGTITIKVDDVTINNLVFQPNTDGAVIVEGNIGVTLNCNIFLQGCNVDSIGVNAYQGSEVEAEFNWWDAPNGPNGGLMDNGDTADGYGVQVIGNVHVEPWIGVHAEATASSHFVETGETIVFNGEGSWAANFNGLYEPIYYWSFDDGTYSYNKIIGHIYDTQGTYNVYLRVRGNGIPYLHSNLMYDWSYLTITVYNPGSPLSANADAKNFGGYETTIGEAVQLYGSAYGGTPPYSWYWDLGNGETSIEQNPITVYDTPGTYTVTLTVTDSELNVATDTATVLVHSIEDLVVRITAPSNAVAGVTMQFQSTVTGGVPPYTYYWDFGDGTTSISKNPTHVYSSEGVYTVTLTVTDSRYSQDTDTLLIVVEQTVSEVEIKEVKGGLGVSATITAGENPVNWEIDVTGGFILFGGHASGTIPADAEETVKTLIIGFGKIDIHVCADTVCKDATAFLLGSLVLNLQIVE